MSQCRKFVVLWTFTVVALSIASFAIYKKFLASDMNSGGTSEKLSADNLARSNTLEESITRVNPRGSSTSRPRNGPGRTNAAPEVNSSPTHAAAEALQSSTFSTIRSSSNASPLTETSHVNPDTSTPPTMSADSKTTKQKTTPSMTPKRSSPPVSTTTVATPEDNTFAEDADEDGKFDDNNTIYNDGPRNSG